MGYDKRRGISSLIVSTVAFAALIYLILSATIAMSLVPALGAGGLYAQANFIEGQTGTVYPEYQGGQDLVSFEEYGVDITTTVPSCGDDGIPMLVVDLDGEARAGGFEFRKDVKLPFAPERWMVIELTEPAVTISGDNLKIFTTQMTGSFLEVKNARVIEGGNPDMVGERTEQSDEQWGPNSNQFIIKGGVETQENVPGLRGQDIEAWIHGATGERVTIETPPNTFVNVDISYETTSQVEGFYTGDADGEDAKLGFGLEDQNIDWQSSFDEDDERVRRGTTGFGADDDDGGYFTCSDLGGVGAF